MQIVLRLLSKMPFQSATGVDLGLELAEDLPMESIVRDRNIFRFKSRLALAAIVCLATAGIFQRPAAADERVILNAMINGQPVRLAFDTGSSRSALFRDAASRLGVKAPQVPPEAAGQPGKIWVPISEPLTLSFGEISVTTSFGVLDSGVPAQFDGFLAWSDVRDNILVISGQDRSLNVLDKLPKEVKRWPHWKLVDPTWDDLASQWLGFQVTQTNGRSRSVIYLDTGDDGGVRLCGQQMNAWRAANPGAPVTMMAHYYPGLSDGLVVREEYWATNLDLGGPLKLTGVPVSRSTDSENGVDSYRAALGLFALQGLNVVVDGVAGEIYIQLTTPPSDAWTHSYNRIGAVFTPLNIHGGDLTAKVLPNSPAYAAGVRDGDTLTRIDDLDVTKWRTDPRILPLSRFWSRPAGTKINIGCQRGGTNLDFNLTLKEIFPLGPSSVKLKSKTP
jgi:hypothetical protein